MLLIASMKKTVFYSLILAILYYAAGRLGQMMALPPGYVTPIWPSSGIALAAVVLFGYSILPGVFLGSFFNNLLLFESINLNAILVSSGIGIGATLQAAIGAYLIERLTNKEPFSTAFNVFIFILIALVSSFINPNTGLFFLSLVQSVNWKEAWWTWWLGDSIGILIFTPLILTWAKNDVKISTFKVVEYIVILLLITLLVKTTVNYPYYLTYILLPPIVWTAFRFSFKGVSLALFYMTILFLWETKHGRGPFASMQSTNISFVLLDMFLGILSSVGLLIAGAIAQTDRIVEERTLELKNRLAELKKMQHFIVMKEKLASLGTLAAGVAHEIKNPLNFITNFSEISEKLIEQLKIEYKKPNENLETLKLNISKISEHAHRADATIQAMLLHARERPGEIQETDINVLIQEYTKLTFHSKKQKYPDLHVQIRSELDYSMKPIFANKQELCRVILNLLDNAFDAVEEKIKTVAFEPEITIKTKDYENEIEIIIHDNGIGIPEEVKSKIFAPFFSSKGANVGTGLGLSISHDIIVKQHGGTITFDSKEGEFTTFIICIPKKK